MKALLLVALGVGLAAPGAAAQSVSRSGTTAGAFLQMGVGPRAEALGGAVTAGVSDATALYWNPAGLAQMTTGEAVSAHSDRFGDLSHDYIGVAVPLWGGVAGASVTRLGVPAQEVRTELDQDGTGETFDASSLALGVTYGRAITDRFALGGTVKLIQERIWHSSASAVAVDIGTQFRTDFFGGLTIGAQLSNFGTDMRLDGRDLRTSVDPAPSQDGNNGQIPADYALDAWSLPLDFKLGVVARPVRSALNQLTIAVDALHPSTNYESLNVGAEYGFRDRFFLRGGFQGLFLEEAEGGLSLGVGVHQPLPYPDGMAKLDVAYRDAGRLGRVQTIGLSITF
ncbi:MAG TPA: PorV/PorQ family protein [Rubricoccaceae bacterium]|jgi:hypothetical protein